ncbi:MAG: hypothetical protein M3020_24005 [Myxococcota bacterium]|nr:hypothetical protein [Myxococcota bacterium]
MPNVSVRGRCRAATLVALCCSAYSLAARADRTPEKAEPSPRPGYEVWLEAHERFATRRDFDEPVFLVQAPVDEIRVQELGLTLGLRLGLLLGLSARFELPFVHRRAAIHYAPLLVSRDEFAPSFWTELQGSGLRDPVVALDYEPWSGRHAAVSCGAGAVIPGDDNPGGALAPERLPPSTGQSEWFLEGTLDVRFSVLALELGYHGGYHPGDASTYLVRRLGGAQVASGVLGDYTTHRLRLAAVLFPSARVSLSLAPSLWLDENPPLVVKGREYSVFRERLRAELGLEARLSTRLGGGHRLELFAADVFLNAHEQDPFFPIDVPERGFGLAFRTGVP